MLHIDETTYSISEKNHYNTKNHKTQIILAVGLRKDSNHITRLQHKEFGKTKKWCTYTIARDGTIYEHFSPKFHSDFMGDKPVDKQSIVIVIENMGCLYETPTGKYISWLNEICEKENVVEKDWLGYRYWENFTDEQIVSAVELCKLLCIEFNVPKLLIDFLHHHANIKKFSGIAFRSNYIENSSDINPLFDIVKFNEMLNT